MFEVTIGKFTCGYYITIMSVSVEGNKISLKGVTPNPLRHEVEETMNYFRGKGIEIVLINESPTNVYEVYITIEATSIVRFGENIDAIFDDDLLVIKKKSFMEAEVI